jgi:hypothetical protein
LTLRDDPSGDDVSSLLALKRGDAGVEVAGEEKLAVLPVGIVTEDEPKGISGRVDGEDQRGRACVIVAVDGEEAQEIGRDGNVDRSTVSHPADPDVGQLVGIVEHQLVLFGRRHDAVLVSKRLGELVVGKQAKVAVLSGTKGAAVIGAAHDNRGQFSVAKDGPVGRRVGLKRC